MSNSAQVRCIYRASRNAERLAADAFLPPRVDTRPEVALQAGQPCVHLHNFQIPTPKVAAQRPTNERPGINSAATFSTPTPSECAASRQVWRCQWSWACVTPDSLGHCTGKEAPQGQMGACNNAHTSSATH